ncbi:MAG: HPr kinase/phosphatase C-terminal domain-containing protein, partial [Rhodospirillales bacterium]|nr:HPr kinase/phosphatase C-terminal domain-containing protein [Rhodospirillales bacterium]
MLRIHATCVEIDGGGVLLRGESGSGKSDLALRLIDSGARLVADDQVELVADAGRLVAAAPRRLAGLMEVRGLGIVALPHLDAVPVRLAVDLVPPAQIERMPQPQCCNLAGMSVPLLRLAAFEAS